MNTRDESIYIPAKLKFALYACVHAANGGGKDPVTESKITVDALVSDILTQWLREHKPKVLELAEEREGFWKKAVEAAKP